MTMLGPQSAPGLPEEAIGLPAEAVDADFSDHELCPEWRILATARPNLLVEHVVPGAQETIMGMLPSCAEPILQWGQDAPCSLPTERRGTLVIARADKLDRAHQQCLFRWLDAPT